MKFCFNCGTPLQAGVKFCPECGQKIPQPESTAAQPASPAEEIAAAEKRAKSPKEKAPKKPKAPKAPKASKPPKPPKEPKEINPKLAVLLANKKLLIIIAAAIVVILAIVLICCLGGKGDGAHGLYTADFYSYNGEKFYAEDEWLDLKKNGKGSAMFMGEEYSVKWELEGKKFTLIQDGDKYSGTLDKGLLTVDFDGVIYTYIQLDNPLYTSELGYWTLKYADGEGELAIDKETVEMLKAVGFELYVEFFEDGTGIFCIDEPCEITWGDGMLTAEGESVSYVLADGELAVMIDGSTLHFGRTEGAAEEVIYLDISSPELYKAVYGTLKGMELDEEKLQQLGNMTITFYGNGSAEMDMFGKTGPISYDNDVITAGGSEMAYDYDYDSIYLYMADGIEFALEYMGAPETLPKELLGPNDLQYWSGDYYGWWCIENVSRGDDGVIGDWWDCCASLDIDSDGFGTLTLWDENSSKRSPMAEMDVSVSTTAGTALIVSEAGKFHDGAVEHGDWILDSGTSAYGNTFEFVVTYEDDESSMDCKFILRPWGTLWEDFEEDCPDDLPYYYYDWYLPLLENGAETAPRKIS